MTTRLASAPVVETFTRRASIAGMVRDAMTGGPLPSAEVQITGMPATFRAWLEVYRIPYGALWPKLQRRPDRARTGPDGDYLFCDLPEGDYTLEAVLPDNGGRYASGSQSVAVSYAVEPGYGICDIDLSPTSVTGTVSAGLASAISPVQMAVLKVAGSGEGAESAKDGSYRIVGLQPGEREVSVTARGFVPAVAQVRLQAPGSEAVLDISLVPETGGLTPRQQEF